MAGIAAVGRQGAGMADAAGTISVFVIHIERMRPVIPRRQPAAGIVAGCAAGAQNPGMVAGFPVAGRAVRGRALENAVAVTGSAGRPGMCAAEREGSQVMIHRGSLPAAGVVALRTGLAELPAVPVVRLVTGVAVLGRAAVLVTRVALHAGHLPVPARERKGGCAVIEAGSLPAAGVVALHAGLAELSAVPVVRLVTGVAVLGQAAVLVTRVALGAGNLRVSARERECRQAVIKGDRLPAHGGVALGAILA